MRFYLILLLLLSFSVVRAQTNDCVGSEVICSSETFDFNPNGSGMMNELNDPTVAGCLSTGENSSVWFYFEIDDNAPLAQNLTFLIVPENGINQDYDFALYGPNVTCDNLGAPIRCSYAFNSPTTGLVLGSFDTSENENGDGYVKEITVNPGEGYFLLIDNFNNDGVGFQLEWGQSGAESLDCEAEPPCAISMDFTYDNICKGEETINLDVEIEAADDDLIFSWTSPTGNIAWLESTNVQVPKITVPSDFVGQAEFQLSVEYIDFQCTESQSFVVEVYDFPLITDLSDEVIFCSNDPINIGSSESYMFDANLAWIFNDTLEISTNQLIDVITEGEYTFSVEENGCKTTDSIIIEKIGVPIDSFALKDLTEICDNSFGSFEVSKLEGGTSPYLFTFENGDETQDFRYDSLERKSYTLMVSDVDGCTAEKTISLSAYLETIVELGNDEVIDLGDEISIANGLNLSPSDILSSIWTFRAAGLAEDVNQVDFQPLFDGELLYTVINSNGCIVKDSIDIRVLVKDKVFLPNAFSPNADENNDVFFVQSANTVKQINYLRIYTRWGELVFEQENFQPNDISLGWDGTFHGSTLNMGSLQVISEIELINGSVINKNGSVVIIR